MRISNCVKRNVSLTLTVIGLLCVVARAWTVALNPSSLRAWFDLCAMLLLTYLCFDNYLIHRRRVAKGIRYGSD